VLVACFVVGISLETYSNATQSLSSTRNHGVGHR